MVKNLIIIAIAIVVLIAGWWIVTWQEPPVDVQRAAVQDTTTDTATGTDSVEISNETVPRIVEEVPAKEISIVRQAGVVSIAGDTEGVVVDTERSHFTFTGYAIGKSHTGTFETMEATVQLGENGPIGGTLQFDPSSVKTDTAMVDDHLKRDDFFNVAVYDTIAFSGTLDAEAAMVRGDLTFLATTKNIAFPVTLTETSLEVDTIINTADFGLENPSANAEVRIQGALYWNKVN